MINARETVGSFTDAQPAIRRMTPEEPGPGQIYTLQARNHIAVLLKVSPDIVTEIRWSLACQVVPGNKQSYELSKHAAVERDAGGVERLIYWDRSEYARYRFPGLSHTQSVFDIDQTPHFTVGIENRPSRQRRGSLRTIRCQATSGKV